MRNIREKFAIHPFQIQVVYRSRPSENEKHEQHARFCHRPVLTCLSYQAGPT